LKLSELLDKFAGRRVLVLGDLMLDEYIFGRATRISPEAPVMVVRHMQTSRVPGGAANVARNIIALGGEAHTIGVAGCDEAGNLLENSLIEHGLSGALLVRDPERATTRKTRVLADHTHQVLRIDQEDDMPVSEAVATKILEGAKHALERCDVVVLSDYLKGVLTPEIAGGVLAEAKMLGKPVVVNPKPRTKSLYAGADLISLNRAEATEALGEYRGLVNAEAMQAASRLKTELRATSVLVTLGESGMAASGPSDFFIDAPKVEVYDTAGAGDTVIATVALGLAAVGYKREIFELAAQTAGSVVRHVGVATPSARDLEQIRAL
jgi:D-beta-D-heptose 7-phosphate kinase/D-beta-D-heptose 1-phosphate adenosyltransferase